MIVKAGDKQVGLPYPLDRVKDFLRTTGTDQDGVISRLIAAAADIIEHETWVVMGSRSYTLYMDSWISEIQIPKFPVASITTVKYYDTSNSLQTMSSGDYYSDLSGDLPRLYITEAPGLYSERYNAIEVAFVAGWANWRDIPDHYVSLLEMIVHQMYDGRQGPDGPMDVATQRMMANYTKRIFT